jgi:predicted DNA binding CopG/RHH family protein
MSNRKKVNISQKPDNKVSNIDQWVTERTTDSTQPEQTTEKMKRLTLDIPESLHQAIKLKAVEQGVTMANMLRGLLEEHYR